MDVHLALVPCGPECCMVGSVVTMSGVISAVSDYLMEMSRICLLGRMLLRVKVLDHPHPRHTGPCQ